VSFRLREEEWQAAQKKAGELQIRKVSEFARQQTVNGKASPPDPLYPLLNALSRAGNLVNQQMSIAHTDGRIPPVLERMDEKLETAIDAVLEMLDRRRRA
jgi:hypothetical protein